EDRGRRGEEPDIDHVRGGGELPEHQESPGRADARPSDSARRRRSVPAGSTSWRRGRMTTSVAVFDSVTAYSALRTAVVIAGSVPPRRASGTKSAVQARRTRWCPEFRVGGDARKARGGPR